MNGGGMNTEQYLQMCEQMGWEPKEEEMPIDPGSLSEDCQYVLLIINALPDIWEGMSGSWLGKDYSGLEAIMNIYEIDNRRAVFELLQIGEQQLSTFYKQKQKENSSKKGAK
jgi:hypothetical protein